MSYSVTTTTTTATPSATVALTRAKAGAEGSPTWDELLGSKNWAGLLEPELNLSLREFILRCGDFCQATYDAFNSTKESPCCGNTNYGKANFFHDVILKDASRYQVVSFLYATAGIGSDLDRAVLVHPSSRTPCRWDDESNWFGYVAVTTDKFSHALGRREVYVAWRGTIMSEEWASNILRPFPVSVKPLLSQSSTAFKWGRQEPMVHDGWLKIYTTNNARSNYVKTSPRAQLHAAIDEIKKRYAGEKLSVVVVGHSLGGSLATLSGFDLAENNVAGGDDVRVTVVGFGCPQVGNPAFKEHVEELPNLKILLVTNFGDTVPKLPDFFLRIYVQIETAELDINTTKSPYLKKLFVSKGDLHNLQAYLHAVAGWNGADKPFELKVKRSLALVNKSCDYLKEEYKIPGQWWCERNKGMEYDAAADEWIFDPPPPPDQMTSMSFA